MTELHPVYLVAGEEEFLKKEAIGKLEKIALAGGDRQLNSSVFYANDTPLNQVLTQAAILPFLSPKRFIVVKNFDKLLPSDREVLLRYVKNPRSTACLVLETSETRFTEGFYGELKGYTRTIFCKRLKGFELTKWVEERVKLKKKKITEEGVQLLYELAGDDLGKLDNEIQKLITFVGAREKINRLDVEELTGASTSYTTFELLDAVSENDTDGALLILKTFLRNRKKEHEILGLLGWHLRRVLEARELLEARQTRFKVAEELNIPSFFLNKFIAQVKKMSKDKIKHFLGLLLRADVRIKKGFGRPQLILEEVVVELCKD